MKKIAKTSFLCSASAIISVMLGYLCNINTLGLLLLVLTIWMGVSLACICIDEEELAQRKRKRFLKRRSKRVINYR